VTIELTHLDSKRHVIATAAGEIISN
jgi:hypothetical protein